MRERDNSGDIKIENRKSNLINICGQFGKILMFYFHLNSETGLVLV